MWWLTFALLAVLAVAFPWIALSWLVLLAGIDLLLCIVAAHGLQQSYRWLHRKFWCGINRCCHFVMDHTALGGRLWHWASFADWAAHELANYTRPNRKSFRHR